MFAGIRLSPELSLLSPIKKYCPLGTVNTGVLSANVSAIFNTLCSTPFGSVSIAKSFLQSAPSPTGSFAQRGIFFIGPCWLFTSIKDFVCT